MEAITLDHKEQKIDALYQLIAKLNSLEDCRALFDDLCTRKEVENMAERIAAAKQLMEGCTYAQIIAQGNISSATLSRVSRCVQYGGGYSKLLASDK
jgi:TrpR-related protein YerC/YecD